MARRTGRGAASKAPSRSTFQLTMGDGGDGLLGAAGGGALPSGDGRPRRLNATGPDSCMAAARPSRRCGTTPARRASRCSSVPSHTALPASVPAPRVLSASWRWKSLRSRRSGRLNSPRNSAVRRRSGRRRSFQRPGRVLSSVTVADIGASLARAASVALPASRVCGARADSADRSSSRVFRSSVDSGQASSGRSPACRSTAGGSRPASGTPRSVPLSLISGRLPLACSTAAQRGASASAAGRSVACSDSGIGARVAMRPAASSCTPCHWACSAAMRCSAPGCGSSSRPCADRRSTGASASISNSSMFACCTLNCSGGAMLAGSGIGRGPGLPVCSVILRTCT